MNMGIFGHDGEFKPRYGLWLDDSIKCQAAVNGLLAEGYDCRVVLKLGGRCQKHSNLAFRPVLWLSQYVNLRDRDWVVEDSSCDASPGCYIREVFFPNDLWLIKKVSLLPNGAFMGVDHV